MIEFYQKIVQISVEITCYCVQVIEQKVRTSLRVNEINLDVKCSQLDFIYYYLVLTSTDDMSIAFRIILLLISYIVNIEHHPIICFIYIFI